MFSRQRKSPKCQSHYDSGFSKCRSFGFKSQIVLGLVGSSSYLSNVSNRPFTDTSPPFNCIMAKAICRITFAVYDLGFGVLFNFWNQCSRNSPSPPLKNHFESPKRFNIQFSLPKNDSTFELFLAKRIVYQIANESSVATYESHLELYIRNTNRFLNGLWTIRIVYLPSRIEKPIAQLFHKSYNRLFHSSWRFRFR